MKYGLIDFSPIDVRKDKFVNIGDAIQTHAIHMIYKSMNIKEEDIVYINLNNLTEYSGEYVLLPININLSLNWIINIFPLSDYIIPVFLGLSYFSASSLPKELVEYFRIYGPIGCRDEATLRLMRENNIPAFLMGCVTLSIPESEMSETKDKIYLVDVPREIIEYIPKEIMEAATLVENSHIYELDECSDLEKCAADLLQNYAKDGKMVITSRLHCMAPCMAMGVPTIALVENCSERYSFIDRFIKINTYDRMHEIDWYNIAKVDLSFKQQYLRAARKMIEDAFEKYSVYYNVSSFYENRERAQYNNLYLKILQEYEYDKDSEFEYIIWGTGQIGMGLFQTIRRYFVKAKLCGAIDSYCTGDFFGCEIKKPESFCFNKKTRIFIASYSGAKEIKKILEQKQYVEGVDYISFATKNG